MRWSRQPSLIACLLSFAAFGSGCDTRSSGLRLEHVVGPQGGDVLTIEVVSDGGKVVAASEFGLFVHDDSGGRWRLQPGLGVNSDAGVATRTLARDGAQLNYPREQLLTTWGDAVWTITEMGAEPALLRSDTSGARWEEISFPEPLGDDQEGNEETVPVPPTTARAAEPPRLVATDDALYIVGTDDIWSFEGTRRAPKWESIGLDGLPVRAEGLPPAIRNYLPRAGHRPFELLTVLTDQLMVFRRSDPDDAWVLTSTLATVDRQLVGIPNAETVFLVTPDAVQRSDDQGEGWFRFWPENNPHLEVLTVAPRDDVGLGFGLVVGATDGSIWTSADAGATWTQSREADADERAISGLALSEGAGAMWASTMGEGVLRSTDGGATWGAVNVGLRATRSLDLAFTEGGDLLLASRAGLHRLAGDPDSGNWVTINPRATTAVHIDRMSGRIVSGSTIGDITTQAVDTEPTHIANPFGEALAFEFLPRWMSRSIASPNAVVAIAARDSQRWVAWSRQHGGVTSNDGGGEWFQIELSDALENALSDTTVTQLVVEPGDTLYLLEASANSRTPALLWRSEDDGDSWATVHAFARDDAQRVSVRPRPPNYPGVLFATHGDEFKRTLDGGTTWEVIPGPWTGHQIIDFAIQDDRAVLFVDARRHFEIVLVAGIDSEAPVTTRHVVVFPDDARPADSASVGRVALFDRRVALTAGQHVWIGTLPLGRGTIPAGMAMLATIAGAIVLIAFAFLYMRASLSR